MRTSAAFAAVVGAASLYGLSVGCARADAQGGDEQTARGPVELTIFTNDFAQVREVRDVALDEGRTRLSVRGISNQLDQNSVMFDWPSVKDAVVESSTYDLGTSDASHLLTRFVGREVTLVYRGENGRAGERQTGILEVAAPGNVVVRVGDKYVVNPSATIEAPTDNGVVTIPQLTAEVQSPKAQKTNLGVTYLTRGLSWSADYTATLLPNSEQLGLECWATITNATGVEYPSAKISFIAGAVNRAARADARAGNEPVYQETKTARDWLYDAESSIPKEKAYEAMGEAYKYPYSSTATIRPDQMNRVRMMEAGQVQVKRDYAIRLPYLGYGYNSFDPDSRMQATLSVNLTNSEAAGLGQPLPGGTVRFYEQGSDGAPQYIGAAEISDTPVDGRISATLTNVFDLYATGKVVKSEKIDKRRSRYTIEVKVFNQKAIDVNARLVQDIYGNFSIENESIKSSRVDKSTPQWIVPVKAGESAALTYSVIIG